jgi:hypothetical protein
VRSSAAWLGGFVPRFCLRQLCPHLVELAGGFLGGLPLIGQRLRAWSASWCALSGSVRSSAARRSISGACVGVQPVPGRRPVVAQRVGVAACGRFGGLDGRQAGLQLVNLTGQAVGQLGCLHSVGFQVGAPSPAPHVRRQTGVRQL